MKINIIILLLIIISITPFVYAQENRYSKQFNINLISENPLVNTTNKTIVFNPGDMEDITVSQAIVTKSDESGKLTLELEGPIGYSSVTKGYICNENNLLKGETWNCKGIPLFFYANEKFPKVDIIYKWGAYNFTNRRFEFIIQSKNLELCAYMIINSSWNIFYGEQYFPNRIEKCEYNFTLDKYFLPQGMYVMMVTYGYEDTQVNNLYAFYITEENITNPYDTQATGHFTITGSECFFMNGEKQITISFLPEENKNISIFCPNQTNILPTIEKDFTIKKKISVSIYIILAAIIAIGLGIIGSYIYDKVKSKKDTPKKILIIAIIVIVCIILSIPIYFWIQ